MKGTVVQLENLVSRPELNGRRGYIVKPIKGGRCMVNVGEDTLSIKTENLYKVHCLGVPREYRITHETETPKQVFLGVLSQTSSDKFYVAHAQDGQNRHAFFLINVKFFEMAIEKMTTEPLFRVYAMSRSQEGSKILFDQCCAHVPDDLSYPWFVDFTTNQFMELVSRFQSEAYDAKALKKMNLVDIFP